MDEFIRRADAMFAITNSETQAALKNMSGADAYSAVVGILNGIPAVACNSCENPKDRSGDYYRCCIAHIFSEE